jgi:hypothetical protein
MGMLRRAFIGKVVWLKDDTAHRAKNLSDRSDAGKRLCYRFLCESSDILKELYSYSHFACFPAPLALHHMPKKSSLFLKHDRPLIQALAQNDAVQSTVEHSADELLMVNAVLQKNITDEALSHDVAIALQKSENIGDAIAESADELQAVNELLEHEVDERISLERELLATKAALAKAQG